MIERNRPNSVETTLKLAEVGQDRPIRAEVGQNVEISPTLVESGPKPPNVGRAPC